jgi:hypothetical protein
MGRLGSREQRDACYLFDERDMIIKKLNESTMEDIHVDISKYEEYAKILDYMLEECEPWLSEEELAEKLFYDRDYENMVYYLDDYSFDDRNYILRSEIRLFRRIICEKIDEYVKFLDELIVSSSVAFTLYMIQL